MKKKLIGLLLGAAMTAVAVTGCGNGDKTPETQATEAKTEASTQAATEAETEAAAPETEAAAIEALTKEKTIIMIAHRLKTVRHADQIFVIDNGHIEQKGTHDDLMEQDGIYKSFVEGRQEAASWKIVSAV